MSAHEVPAAAVEVAARDLLESDAMTGAGGDTPTHYIVDPENVEYLVSTIITAALSVLRETWEAPIRALVDSKSFGVVVPGARERDPSHNGAHDVVLVSDLRALLTSEATS